MMTFEEWWEREDRVYLNEYSTFKMVAAQAWNHQQKRIDDLERWIIDNWTGDIIDLYFFLGEKYTIGQLKQWSAQESE